MLMQGATGWEWLFWVIIVIYLAFLAVAGYYAKRKTKTLEDFMVAGRKIGPVLLGLSFGVTYFSAVMVVGGGQFSWLWGIGVVWVATIDVLVGVFLVFVLFGSRTRALGEHFESLTVPQFLSKRYQEPKIQTFTSVVILFFETIYLVSIYMGLSLLLAVAMPGNPLAYYIAVMICGIITIFYLNVGGAHGAIWTDAAESLIMLTGVLCIFFFGIYALGGFDAFLGTLGEIEATEAGAGQLTTFPGAGGFGVIGYILVTSFGVWGMPQMITRFYTAEKKKTIRWGLTFSCVWAFIVAIFAWFNGAIARAYFYKNDTKTYNAISAEAGATAIPMLMVAVLPPILIGLFLAAITAASLTTGEKVIMIAASGFSIDVYQPRTGASDDRTLFITKVTTTIVVIVAVFLAFLRPGAVLAICMFAWSAMAATILIPYVFGLFWKGGTSKAVLWSGAIALISAILWFFMFRGAAAWAAVGLTYPAELAAMTRIPLWTFGMRITIGSVHEFIVSQVFALIAFPIVSKLTRGSKPSSEFLNEIFDVMKTK
jgi:SSS family solute:Na+ symporter